MSRYSRYPYQNATTVAHASHQPQIISHHQQLRNPWVSEPAPLRPSESQSTNSSSSSRTPQPWLQQPHFNPRAAHYAVQVLDGPPVATGSGTVPGIPKTHSSRPVTPASSPGGASGSGGGGAVDGCGGHCVAFENFCYYCLQVIFIAGILTGVSLTIAGSVLRTQQRGSDLLVLVYIGCMLAMVCALLLAVQCCVRRNVKRRKRVMRASRDHRRRPPAPAPAHAPNPTDMIPLQEMGKAQQHPQYQPLLMRLVQQQTADNQRLHPQYIHQPNYRGGGLMDSADGDGVMDTSRSGTPWWRRRGDMRPHMVETRH